MTPEGRAVMAVCDRPGVWRRAGDLLSVTGLDLAEAMRSLPAGPLDRDLTRALFLVAEAAFVTAFDEQMTAQIEASKNHSHGDH